MTKATVRGVAPQKRGVIPDDLQRRLLAARAGQEAAEAEFRAAVVAALLADGSVREVAALTGLSTNTVNRWGKDGGWPSEAQKKARAEARERGRAMREYLAEREAQNRNT